MQVRLEPDVAAALQATADRVGSGSVAHHANRKLRQALGLPNPGHTPDPTPGERFAQARIGSAAGKPIGGATRTDRARADAARRAPR